tara:strand:+ start:114 stop:533 length:420 start_codon:yes stop_codon:yes gene_type:complete
MATFGKYIKDDGGRSNYYPKVATAGDCVIRACAIATGSDYFNTFKELSAIGLEIGDLANSEPVYEEFLRRRGFSKNKTPKNSKGKKISVREFTATAPAGHIIALTRLHLIAIVDNVQRDIWLDERCVNSWYHKANRREK